MRIDICNRMQYNGNFINRITAMGYVCGIFNNGIACVLFVIAIDIWIEVLVSSLSFVSYASSIIFEKTGLKTPSIIECIYNNNNNVAITINNFYKISGAARIFEMFLIVIYFIIIIQLIDGLSLNIILLIGFGELILHLTVQFVNYCHIQVIVINETLNIEHQFFICFG